MTEDRATRAGHVLIKVAELRAAVEDYRAAGFTVDYATAEDKAHNAHVWFAEGPFLELFELPSVAAAAWPLIAVGAGTAMAGRVARWARTRTEGYADLALEVAALDLDADRRVLNARGAGLGRVARSSRVRPDGQRVGYQYAMSATVRAPFLVSAYDPPQRPAATAHPNGATAITSIDLGVAPADRAVVDALVDPSDPWLRCAPADRTGVRAVTVAGLTETPDPTRLRGAVVVRA